MELPKRKTVSFMKKKALLRLYRASHKRRTKLGLKGKHFSSKEIAKEDAYVKEFRAWCTTMRIMLNKKLYIGRAGSCHEIGVLATDTIREGEVIARIPRSAVFTASRGVVMQAMRGDEYFMSRVNHMTPWVPLLIALAAEYALKGQSKWQPYLYIVPNNASCPPPMLWRESERQRLLQGTGINFLVQRDLQRTVEDYTTIVEPFFKRHSSIIPKTFHSQYLYEKNVSFVMSYSFTDSSSEVDPLSETMMVPFADLLNHHTEHNAELSYHMKYLELVAIKDIMKGQEVMNTFGQLPNYSLLHTYGFVIPGNKHDAACITPNLLREVYFSLPERPNAFEMRWNSIKQNGLLSDVFEVDNEGVPEEELLKIIRVLMSKTFFERCKTFEEWSVSVDGLKPQEKELLKRIIVCCVQSIPESLATCQRVLESGCGSLSCREKPSLIVTTNSLKCLQKCLQLLR